MQTHNCNNNVPVVVGIGEVLWDLLPEGRRLGGAPANFAYHAAMQGAEAYAVSAVGDDANGSELLVELRGKKLSTEYIAELPLHSTGTVTVKLNDGMPSYTIHAPVAWDFIPWNDRLEQLARQADAVCFGTLAQRGNVSAETIIRFLDHTRPDCLKVFDVNLRQTFFSKDIIDASLRQCNLLKISDEELPVVAELFGLYGADEVVISELMRRYNLKYAVLTRGKDGSAFYDGKGIIAIPAYDYGAKVDTVGCGDSFTATLTAGLLFGFSLEAAMTRASKIAGLVCASAGAMPEIPEELRLNNHKDTRHDLE